MSLAERRHATTEARNIAVQRLRAAHPDEYRRLYEEAIKRGIRPHAVSRAERIARLQGELTALLAEEENPE